MRLYENKQLFLWVLCRRALESLTETACMIRNSPIRSRFVLLCTTAKVTQSLDQPCWNKPQNSIIGLGQSQCNRLIFTLMKEKCNLELQPLVLDALPYWNKPVTLLSGKTNALKAEDSSCLPQTPEGTRHSSFFQCYLRMAVVKLDSLFIMLKKI